MFTKFIAKSRRYVRGIVEKNPLTLYIAEFFLLKFSFFLPHDNEYYGFLRLADKKHGLFLDVGANDGRSILSFHKLKKDWDIFSIEANPLHIPQLKKIKSKIPRVKFIIKAVDKTKGKKLILYTPIYLFYKIHTPSSVDLKYVKKNIESVFGKKISGKVRYKKTIATTIKIDDLNLSPDIIKMDLEGWELNALLGCVNTIKRCLPYFLIEYNPDDFKKICKFFRDRNYLPYGFDSKNMEFTKFSKNEFRNCFFIPDNIKIL